MGAQTTLLSFSKGCNSRCSQFVTFSLIDNSNIVACGRIDCFSQTFHLEGCCFEFKQIGEGSDWTSFVGTLCWYMTFVASFQDLFS